jgi:hypothetical protein
VLDAALRSLIEHGLLASVLGALGRLLSLANSQNKPKGWLLLWEIPLAIGMGVIGISIADAFKVTNTISYGIIIGVSYVGPKIIDRLFEIWSAKQKKD